MTYTFLNKGNLLDIIKTNSTSSIRGIENPHLVSLAQFLFMDHDFKSFTKLYNFHKNSDINFEELSFHFGLSYIAFHNKLDGQLDKYNLEKEFKNLDFINRDLKKILTNTFDFIINKNSKSFLKINKLKLDNEIILLCKTFCFKYTNLNFKEYINYFPELKSIFSLNDENLLSINSDKELLFFIENNGLFALSFTSKFYDILDNKAKHKISYELFKRRIFDANLLNNFLVYFFDDDHILDDFTSFLSVHKPFLDEKIYLGLSHYILLKFYLINDYESLLSWYGQYIEKLDGEPIKRDFDGSIDWNLDDNAFEPVSYWSYQKNSRFFLNSLSSLAKTRDSYNKISSENNLTKKINIIGGLQALSCQDIFNSNVSFHYLNKYFNNSYSFSINDLDKSFLNQDDASTIFILDIEMFLNVDIKNSLITLLNDIEVVSNFNNVTFATMPYPSLKSHNHLPYNDIYSIVNVFNSSLMSLKDEYGFKVLEISKYIDQLTEVIVNTDDILPIYSSNDNLLCDYFIKPDIIRLLINEHSV
tara:strand:- start:6094 stop:7686 length:1593 start_codon:yes stop_codon:yes gene_type:complete